MNYSRKHWLFFCGITLILTVLFNFNLLKNIVIFNPATIPFDDGVVTEFIAEIEYQNIMHGKNPFSPTNKIFYPNTTSIVNQDLSAINLIPQFFLRPFIDIHQATVLIVLINIILANVLMFALLKKLHIGWQAAFIASLVFGFSPFISYRVLGHYTYTTHYFFPLLLLVAFEYCHEMKIRKKKILAISWGILWALLFYANPYYFIMAGIAVFFFIVYFIIAERKKTLSILTKSLRDIIFALIPFFIILSPWITAYKEFLSTHDQNASLGIIRSLILSADTLSFVTPSEYNPFYSAVFNLFGNNQGMLSNLAHFFEYNWNSFAYPGIIVIACYALYFLRYKQILKRTRRDALPFALAGLFFALLSLGPLLKIANRWSITLPEDIPVYFPLPYLLFHFFPFLKDLTAPARFVAGFVFFGSLLAAYVLNDKFIKFKNSRVTVVFITLFVIFFVDQMYFVPNRNQKEIPLAAYNYIASSEKNGSVFEIPFTIRDGLQYMGDVHATSIMRGTVIHGRPIIGGYISRTDPKIFNYYKNISFVAHTAEIIDKGNYHLYKEQPNEPSVTPFKTSVEKMKNEIENLNIEFVLLKSNEKYSALLRKTLADLGFSEIMTDAGYVLYEKN